MQQSLGVGGIIISCSYDKVKIDPFKPDKLIFDISLIYLTFAIYIWYCINIIIGMRQVLKYENYLKPFVISLAPQFLLLIYFLNLFVNINKGIVS